MRARLVVGRAHYARTRTDFFFLPNRNTPSFNLLGCCAVAVAAGVWGTGSFGVMAFICYTGRPNLYYLHVCTSKKQARFVWRRCIFPSPHTNLPLVGAVVGSAMMSSELFSGMGLSTLFVPSSLGQSQTSFRLHRSRFILF